MLIRLQFGNTSCVISVPLDTYIYAAVYNQLPIIKSILNLHVNFHLLQNGSEIQPDLPTSALTSSHLHLSTTEPSSIALKHLHASQNPLHHIRRIWQDNVKSATYLIHGTASPFLALSLNATDSLWNDMLIGKIRENKFSRSILSKLNRIPLRINSNDTWQIVPANSNDILLNIIENAYVNKIPIPNYVNIKELYNEARSCDFYLYIHSL